MASQGSRTVFRFAACGLVVSLSASWLVSDASAAPFSIRSIEFASGPGYSVRAEGTITTLGSTTTITDWNLAVTTTELLAHFTSANTVKSMSGVAVSADGQRLTVATSPDGAEDGGHLIFRSPNPFLDFGASLADFAGSNVNGGQAGYMAGAAFDFLDLNQPLASDYVVAHLAASPGGRFDLLPIVFPGGAVLSGTILTDGAHGPLGPANVRGWDIYAHQITRDVFNPGNSTLQASQLGFTSDGLELAVTRPGGFLAFSKGALGGRPYALQLADFTNPGGGQAAYLRGRVEQYAVDLHASGSSWQVTGDGPVPVPEPSSVVLLGMASLLLAARKGQGTRRR